MQTLEKETGLATNGVRDDLSFGQLLDDGRADQFSIYFKQLLGQSGESLDGQGTVSLVGGGLERERDTRPDPLRGSLFHAELGRNRIRRLEADAAHVLGQPVRVLSHDLDGLITIGLENAHRSRRADAMRMQEDHDLPHRLLLGPPRHDARGSHGANSRNVGQTFGSGLNDLEGVNAKGSDDALGHGRSDAAHLTGGKILLNALDTGRWCCLEDLSLELKSVGSVADPEPTRSDPFAC